MIFTEIDDVGSSKGLLSYLKSLTLLSGDLSIKVQGARRSGRLVVKGGVLVNAQSAELTGNGALLSMIAQKEVEIDEVPSEEAVETNLTVTLKYLESIEGKISDLSLVALPIDEDRLLQEAMSLYYQFRRKECGSKLLQILRSNRFYYPAWLWQSRLMTRKEHILKALKEVRKWGNADVEIKREYKRVIGQLNEIGESFKRCIYCASLVAPKELRCRHCQGLLIMSPVQQDEGFGGEILIDALRGYEEEWVRNSDNRKIAYCLSLGFRSLGIIDVARNYINDALKLSPSEPLFLKTFSLLTTDVTTTKRVEPTPEKPRSPQIPQNQNSSGKTILVVEDSKTSRIVISLVLSRKGYQVVETATGTEALRSFKENVPDLVILDVILPDMTGYDVLEAVRSSEQLSNVPVVMLTGKKGTSDRLKGMIRGANEYLTKPFDPAKLLLVIEKYLGKAEPVEVKKPKVEKKTQVAAPVLKQPAVALKQRQLPEKDRYILVVEDSPTARKVITTVITRNGHKVAQAATGAEALDMLKQQRPRIILLDAILPDMTGYDILAFLKNNDQLQNVPVIMLTSKDSPLDRQRGGAGWRSRIFN